MRSHDASSILGLVCSRRCTSAGQQAIASLYDAGRRRYRVKNSTASAQQRRRRGRGADPIGPDPAGIQSYSEKPQKDKSMCHYGNIRRILVAHAATAAHRGPSVHVTVPFVSSPGTPASRVLTEAPLLLSSARLSSIFRSMCGTQNTRSSQSTVCLTCVQRAAGCPTCASPPRGCSYAVLGRSRE